MTGAQLEGSGRDRILAAAIELFGARGVDGTSMRDIAARAEVSPALVVHHFGSKQGLRDAADAEVMVLLAANRAAMGASIESVARGGADQLGYAALMNVVSNPTLAAYVRRILVDGGPAASALFRAGVAQATDLQRELIDAGIARPTDDVETRAATLIANPLALLILREQITDALGYDPLTPEGLPRWLAGLQELVTRGILNSE
ncbi:MAG: TetR family transcriptional regulator [Demequina sp.]|nr:TetR family transcriptional regulator [Demequina sp.]